MLISIVGAGRVGQTLGRLAQKADYKIGDIVCASHRSATRAVEFIGGGRPQTPKRAKLGAADLVLISTPDDRIEDAVALIARNASKIGPAVVLHTSGVLGSDALAQLRELRMKTGSCHPLQTFESPDRAVHTVASSHFCIEGDVAAVRAATRLVRKIGGSPFRIRTEMKPLYHAAAVLSSGGIIALLSISLEMLIRCGIRETKAQEIVLPLIEATVANARALGPSAALTGPVRRGDAGTVLRNLEALAAVDKKSAQVYWLLADRAVTLAGRAGLDKEALVRVQKALDVNRQ